MNNNQEHDIRETSAPEKKLSFTKFQSHSLLLLLSYYECIGIRAAYRGLGDERGVRPIFRPACQWRFYIGARGTKPPKSGQVRDLAPPQIPKVVHKNLNILWECSWKDWQHCIIITWLSYPVTGQKVQAALNK